MILKEFKHQLIGSSRLWHFSCKTLLLCRIRSHKFRGSCWI